jgi:dolichol-phosphate mannosyltransferase
MTPINTNKTHIEKKLDYSIVIPVYNERDSIQMCYETFKNTFTEKHRTYELIFINDGSKDGSYEILKTIAAADSAVKVINLSRNFGKYNAVMAGFKMAAGNAVISTDCDMQDPIEVICEMCEKYEAGAEIVIGKRKKRQGEPLLKKITAAIFTKFFSSLIGTKIFPSDLMLFSKRVRDIAVSANEKKMYHRAYFAKLGFNVAFVEFIRLPRKYGKSKFNYKKLTALAGNAILSHSNFPFHLMLSTGILLCFLSFAGYIALTALLLCNIAFNVLFWFIPSAVLLLSAALVCCGIVGLYIWRINETVMNRPEYIIADKINF